MQLVNDPKNPTCVARNYSKDEYVDVCKMVDNLNRDLKDSGFDYVYKVVRTPSEIHIQQI